MPVPPTGSPVSSDGRFRARTHLLSGTLPRFVSQNDDPALDRLTRLRRRVLPTLHRVKEPLGGFAQCTMHPAEYVGTVRRDLRSFRPDLRAMGFSPEPISSLKVHRDGRLSAGSWVRRPSLSADRQLHVTLFAGDPGTIELFAHREFSWLTHPYKHYVSEGWDTAGGVSRMRSLLSEHDVAFSIE